MTSSINRLFVLSNLLMILVITPVNAAQSNNFSDFKKSKQQKYQNFKQDYLARYEAYKKDIIEKWGVAELSSNTEFVAYSDDKNIKIIADFENDILEVSLLDGERVEGAAASKLVVEAIVSALNVSPQKIIQTSDEFASSALPKSEENPSKPKSVDILNEIETDSVLSHLGVTNEQDIVQVLSNLEEIPAEQANNDIVERTQRRLNKQINDLEHFVDKDEISDKKQQQGLKTINQLKHEQKNIAVKRAELIKKNTKTYRMKLARSRFDKAEKYLTFVEEHASKWRLEKDVLLAIMETESHFNPLAKSQIPAFGLMQIVPSTAGVDVNRKIFSINNCFFLCKRVSP